MFVVGTVAAVVAVCRWWFAVAIGCCGCSLLLALAVVVNCESLIVVC